MAFHPFYWCHRSPTREVLTSWSSVFLAGFQDFFLTDPFNRNTRQNSEFLKKFKWSLSWPITFDLSRRDTQTSEEHAWNANVTLKMVTILSEVQLVDSPKLRSLYCETFSWLLFRWHQLTLIGITRSPCVVLTVGVNGRGMHNNTKCNIKKISNYCQYDFPNSLNPVSSYIGTQTLLIIILARWPCLYFK